MKKLIIIIISILIMPVSLWAATLESNFQQIMDVNRREELLPFTITADADGEITAEHGISVMIDHEKRTLWEAVDTLTATGTAVDAGKIAATITPTYDLTYRVMNIPVLADFTAEEMVIISGAKMRTYNKSTLSDFMELDLNGDLVADVLDMKDYFVREVNQKNDTIAPYPPANFQAEVAEDLKSVSFTWENPPDWDFVGSSIDRLRIRNGFPQSISVLDRKSVAEFTDDDVQEGDQMTYTLYAQDLHNASEPVVITLTIESAEAETPIIPDPEPEPEPEPETTPDLPNQPDADQEELDLLDRLYNYYKIRQEIKCLRDDSACLWAKINLIYAQEALNRFEVNVSLSERDLYLMGIRIKYTEGRYQTNCVEAEEPAKTCTALARSVRRAQYFLAQQ